MLRSLASWRRDRRTTPLADTILPLVARYGPHGITRGDIGRLVPLERDTLDNLLDGFVRAGLLTMTDVNGVRVYRRQS